jgi:hypothetical protein
VLRDERDWLYQAQKLLADAHRFRQQERLRFWPGVWRRWMLAAAFALLSAAASGAGHAWVTQLCAAKLSELRVQAGLGEAVMQRVATMTPGERRQFDVFMQWHTSPRGRR